MNKVTISDIQSNFNSLLQGLVPGEELVIVSGDKPVAKLVRESNSSNACQAGSAKDTEHWMADDFDEPLADFAEYSE